MAWRIDEHVIRGEIDNRVRGRVTGRIWFAGREAPVTLDLAGNAWRDLAGRRLEFVNPEPRPGLDASFASAQHGAVGDITASRKVKVPEIPLDQIGEYYARRQPWPWHWGNCLYLEWHSDRNGRVVIESATFQLTMAPDVVWDMTEAEELEQRRANGSAMEGFMQRLGDLAGRTAAQRAADEAGEESTEAENSESDDDDRPQTEAEADAMLDESDAMADRISHRLQREGPDANFEQILEEELERRRAQRQEQPLTPEEEREREQRIEELNRAADEALGDPEIAEIVAREHPLSVRARELAVRLAREPEERGWVDETTQQEHPVVELASGIMRGAVKLAGALDGREWPPSIDECALVIASAKRARNFLGDALAAAEVCGHDRLTDADWLAEIRRETESIATELDAILAELRAILQRGFD